MRGYPQWQYFADNPARLWWNHHLQHSAVLRDGIRTVSRVALAQRMSEEPITLVESLITEVLVLRATCNSLSLLAPVVSPITIPDHQNDKGVYNGNQ